MPFVLRSPSPFCTCPHHPLSLLTHDACLCPSPTFDGLTSPNQRTWMTGLNGQQLWRHRPACFFWINKMKLLTSCATTFTFTSFGTSTYGDQRCR
ncbi:hypothetical protein BT69DRAFT_474932 [Atractiella rhizophila]|nr:hypothetical protein BT69DRAFT_474932 [Atractiella rhizophila]